MSRRRHTAKHSRRHRTKRRHSHRRHRRGGATNTTGATGTGTGTVNPSSYSSASSWMGAINGSGDSQYGRVFNQSSPFPANGNSIIGTNGQRAGSKGGSKGGSHKGRRHHSKTYKGGGVMGLVSQALVPLGLIGLQRMFSKKFKKHSK